MFYLKLEIEINYINYVLVTIHIHLFYHIILKCYTLVKYINIVFNYMKHLILYSLYILNHCLFTHTN